MSEVQSPVIPLVGELIKNNPGTISLGQGIVHYSPPKEVQDFLEQFFQDPVNNSYQSVLGLPKLLSALTQK